MWEKIKGILAIIGACITVVCCTIILFLLRRSKADGRRSREADERDTRIKEGIESSEDRAERIKEGITRAEDGIGRCEEHLQRAEDILRGAINRSREKREDSCEHSDRGSDS